MDRAPEGREGGGVSDPYQIIAGVVVVVLDKVLSPTQCSMNRPGRFPSIGWGYNGMEID